MLLSPVQILLSQVHACAARFQLMKLDEKLDMKLDATKIMIDKVPEAMHSHAGRSSV